MGVEFEIKYKDNEIWEPGVSLKDSTILDAFVEEEWKVYDHKFVKIPGKGLRKRQVEKIIKEGPVGLKRTDIIEINPSENVRKL